jgi:2-keto-4-pentenoate hydratase/2-oxohepta-3-ene-1,7-dioic acid hydratase in catechol pathway
VRIARISRPSSLRPAIALVRDDAIYDVATLEELSPAPFPSGFDRSDFGTRVVALRMANLLEVDADLIRGRRPTEARVRDARVLAPFDTDRATYVHVDTREVSARRLPSVRIGHARNALGQDEHIAFDTNESRPEFELSLGILIGEDVRGGSRDGLEKAILGYTLIVDWIGLDAIANTANPIATTRGLSTQVGPVVVPAMLHRHIERESIALRHNRSEREVGTLGHIGLDPRAALGIASRAMELASGDLLGVGPFASGTSIGIKLAMHDELIIDSAIFGWLRGIPVPRR